MRESDQEIVALWNTGLTMTEIASKLGVSRERIRQRLKRNGYAGTNRNSPYSATELLDAVATRTSLAEAAESLGVSESAFKGWIEFMDVSQSVRDQLDQNKARRQEERDRSARERTLAIIRQVGGSGEAPRIQDLAAHGVYAVTLIRYFGSTAAAMRAAGYEPRRRVYNKHASVVHPGTGTDVESDASDTQRTPDGDGEMSWYFRSPSAEESVRDPVHDEFFADDAIRDVGEALVREGIQNALDARIEGTDEPVVVRLGVRSSAANHDAEGAAARQEFMRGIYPHWEAKGNGLARPPRESDALSWIVFEDFGTTGLTGNPGQSFPEDDPNPFFAFFRAEGYSEKRTTQRGRWGLGKFAFPRASMGRCFFGVTVRCDDGRRFLMGRCTLKSHRVNQDRFTPDGFYGVRSPSTPVMPYEDPATIDKFSDAFGLARDGSRAGLSVVVPFVDVNEVQSATLLSAVLRGYWLAILSGDLEVRLVEEDGNVVELTAESLDSVLERLNSTDRELLQPLVELGRWGLQRPTAEIVTVEAPPSSGAPKWTQSVLTESCVQAIRDRLGAGRVKIRVPVRIKSKHPSVTQESWFDILLERTDDGKAHKPLFLREGILISDVRAPFPNGWRGIVLVEHEHLAAFLGDSENPAHTKWLKEGTNFKGRYERGADWISYVIGSPRAVVDSLAAADQAADPSVLADVLAVLLPEDGAPRSKPRPKPTAEGESTVPTIPKNSRRQLFALAPVNGGFAVSGTNSPPVVGATIRVRVAYDLRSGDPFKAWQELDFDLSRTPIRIQEQTHLDILERRENRLRFTVLRDDFRLVIVGFDRWRDLKIDARLETGGEA